MEYTINTKIDKQTKNGDKPIVCFFDIDGTIFSVGPTIANAAIYNFQTKKLLDDKNIPFVLVTGRNWWNKISEIEMLLHGFPKPDIVVIKSGAEIFLRKTNGELERDEIWSKKLTSVESPKLELEGFNFKRKNKNVIVASLYNVKINKLLEAIDTLKKYYKDSAKLAYSESLVGKNNDQIFSGNVFIISKEAGKESAVRYVLDKIRSKHLISYIFGDALMDVSMLALKNSSKYKLQSFLVNPTQLASKESEEYPSIQIVNKEGPIAILEVLKDLKKNTPQNNSARKIIRIFDLLLDKIFDKKFTANDISMMGLNKIIQSLNNLGNGKKTKSIIDFILGNLTDAFDGIRARQKGSSPYGQLVDVLCDRQKEFLQLRLRAEKRIVKNPLEGYHTYLSMISCILPSISRAQKEAKGIIVEERDKKGGSSLDRNGLLFKSLLYFLFNKNEQSYKTDAKIYERNILTFENRISLIDKYPNANSSIRKAAEERLSVLIYLLQKYNKYVKRKLKPYKEIYSQYKLWQIKYIQEYISEEIKLKTKNKDLLYLLSMPE